MRIPLSAFSLICANAIPLVGVLVFDWPVFPIVFLYWFENIVIGAFNVAKMLVAKGGDIPDRREYASGTSYSVRERLVTIALFLFHYGIFILVHGTVLFLLFKPASIDISQLHVGVAALILSHGVSYVLNFVGAGEYERMRISDLFVQPYRRILVLHLVIFLGAALVQTIGTTVGWVVVFVILKTIVDLAAHLWERKRFSPARASS